MLYCLWRAVKMHFDYMASVCIFFTGYY